MTLTITPRHLPHFRMVAEEQNFHRAAERIRTDPSSLSRTIHELEHRLGVELFVRDPRGIRRNALLSVNVLGGSRVSATPDSTPAIGHGISGCTSACSATYTYSESQPAPALELLTATASTVGTFTGWSGACTGSQLTCTVTLNAAQAVSANFAEVASTRTTPGGSVTLSIPGSGSTCVLNGAPTFTVAPTTGTPAGYTFPYGEIGFKAQGCQSGGAMTASLTLPAAALANVKLFKRSGQSGPPLLAIRASASR